MNLERLTIRNFRGIRDTFEIEPEGENVALVGPNGSGKSSVVAAVDFLLNGSIEVLSGEGTRGITAKQHGPHVDADPDDAWVEAEFSADGESIRVRRSLDDRSNPELDASSGSIQAEYEQLADSADRRLHLLSRDEILQFITSRGQRRSDRIRSLLNVNNVKERRRVLGRAKDELDKTASRKHREIDSNEDKLANLLGLESYEESAALEVINQWRDELGGDSLASLSDDEFRHDLESPSDRALFSPVFSSDGRQYVLELEEWLSGGIEEFLAADEEFRDAWKGFDPDQEAVRALQRQDLIELGKSMLGSSEGECPLCQKPWDTEDLERHLEERLEDAHRLYEQKEELEELRDEAQQHLTDVRVLLESFLDLVRQDDHFEPDLFEDYRDTIASWEDGYDGNVLAEPPHHDLTSDERESILLSESVAEEIEGIEERFEAGPDPERLEQVWSDLGAAETRYSELQRSRSLAQQYDEAATQFEAVHRCYIEARDEVLGEIYSDIEEQFAEYYSQLHSDESDLSVDLSSTTAGLDLDVEFHDRGMHPPHALHSEGHQDSMGICLHFALCDWLREERSHPLIMLDDVVMSIDKEHRKPLADLLASELSDDYQLIITTHDDLWHRHLRSEGVISSQNAVRFVNWDIENGPRTMGKPEMEWETVYELLDEGKVPSAAFQTRRLSEWFLREACDQLDAKVRFASNSNWTLGDFEQAAKPRLKGLIGEAKQAEQSWGNDIDHLNELEDELKKIFEDLDQHGAALNPNVHWNEVESEFSHCTPDELRPAVEAYHALYDVLWCSNCNSSLRLEKQGQTATGVRCRCSRTQWNLEEK